MKLHTKEIHVPLGESTIAHAEVVATGPLFFLIITSDAHVSLFDAEKQELKHLLILPENIPLGNVAIYYYKGYCAIVDNRGVHGIVIHLQDPTFAKYLSRGDYQVEHCSFPIAFYEDANRTFLIHGTDWNRLDVTCLETDVLFTKRTVDAETKTNYVDYFHSLLSMSPNQNRFLSNGWFWSPRDTIAQYDLGIFLKEYENSSRSFDFPETTGYLWDRPVVWITSNLVAIAYNKQEAGEEGKFPSELIFININQDKTEKKIDFDGFGLNEYGEVEGRLFCRRSEKMLIVFSKEKGLTITDYEGMVLLQDKDFFPSGYSEREHVFWEVRGNTVVVTEVVKGIKL